MTDYTSKAAVETYAATLDQPTLDTFVAEIETGVHVIFDTVEGSTTRWYLTAYSLITNKPAWRRGSNSIEFVSDLIISSQITATFSEMTALVSTKATQVSVTDYPRKGVFDVVTDDISAEVTLDPEGGYYVPFSGTDGSTGGFVRDLSLAPNARFFGAEYMYHDATPAAGEITTASALNTTAIQAMINWTAHHRRIECYIGIGRYYFGRLYLTHDANNTGFPSDQFLQGRVTLNGEGVGSFLNYRTGNDYVGTHLISTDPVGPAIYANGDPVNLDKNNTNKVRIEKLAVSANNTTQVVYLFRCPQQSGMTDVVLIQDGAGDGYIKESKWNGYDEDVVCEGPENSTGIGVHIFNSTAGVNSFAGGFNRVHGITSNKWRVAVIFGGEKSGDGKRDHGYTCSSIQGGKSDIGVKIGHGIQNISITGSHCEGNKLGYHIGSGASGITLHGTTSNNQLDMLLGYTASTGIPDVDAALTAAGQTNADDNCSAIDIFSSFNVGDATRKHIVATNGAVATTIHKPQFIIGGVAAPNLISAIELEPATYDRFEIIDEDIAVGYPTEIVNEIRLLRHLKEQNSIARIANGTTQQNAMDVPFAKTVIGENTANSSYRLANIATNTLIDGFEHTFINSTSSTGFYNIKHSDNTTILAVVQPGQQARIVLDNVLAAWEVFVFGEAV